MYDKVLVALDLSESSQKVLDTALELVGNDSAKLILAHVVDPIPIVWGMESYAMDPIELQDQIVASAHKLLNGIASKAGIEKMNQHSLLGAPADEIRRLAEEQNVDAIVIGSHGYGGWKMLLGSTAIKLLHGANCDVLTVYVGGD
ncbi:MAG: universal stress protein [Pseudohongiella sp.]|jgi:universal stress protein A|nr:universal stress protein [Pseudohongiella sp.]